jgi:hypothetical protein
LCSQGRSIIYLTGRKGMGRLRFSFCCQRKGGTDATRAIVNFFFYIIKQKCWNNFQNRRLCENTNFRIFNKKIRSSSCTAHYNSEHLVWLSSPLHSQATQPGRGATTTRVQRTRTHTHTHTPPRLSIPPRGAERGS